MTAVIFVAGLLVNTAFTVVEDESSPPLQDTRMAGKLGIKSRPAAADVSGDDTLLDS